jgi:hypothetical protein
MKGRYILRENKKGKELIKGSEKTGEKEKEII